MNISIRSKLEQLQPFLPLLVALDLGSEHHHLVHQQVLGPLIQCQFHESMQDKLATGALHEFSKPVLKQRTDHGHGEAVPVHLDCLANDAGRVLALGEECDVCCHVVQDVLQLVVAVMAQHLLHDVVPELGEGDLVEALLAG